MYPARQQKNDERQPGDLEAENEKLKAELVRTRKAVPNPVATPLCAGNSRLGRFKNQAFLNLLTRKFRDTAALCLSHTPGRTQKPGGGDKAFSPVAISPNAYNNIYIHTPL